MTKYRQVPVFEPDSYFLTDNWELDGFPLRPAYVAEHTHNTLFVYAPEADGAYQFCVSTHGKYVTCVIDHTRDFEVMAANYRAPRNNCQSLEAFMRSCARHYAENHFSHSFYLEVSEAAYAATEHVQSKLLREDAEWTSRQEGEPGVYTIELVCKRNPKYVPDYAGHFVVRECGNDSVTMTWFDDQGEQSPTVVTVSANAILAELMTVNLPDLY